MTRIEKINSYYSNNFEKLEKLHNVLNDAVGKNINADNYKILGWESRAAQYSRFSAFAKNTFINLDEMSLLDVGCGLADLYHFLTIGLNKNIKYVGIDISEKMILIAKSQLNILKQDKLLSSKKNKSTIELFTGDIFADDFLHQLKKSKLEKFDYVYASGIFNLNLGNNEEFVKSAFSRFVQFCKTGFSCSMLNVRSKDQEKPYFYYDPKTVKKWAFDVGAKSVDIIDDYLENDFTIIAKM